MTDNTNIKPTPPYRKTHQRPVETSFVNPSLTIPELTARSAVIAEELSDVLTSIASIEAQIGRSESAEGHGNYADPLWLRKVNGALAHCIRERDQHGRALANIRRRVTKLENTARSREKAFISVVESLLPVESVREIWRRVEAGDDAGFVGVAGVQVERAQA